MSGLEEGAIEEPACTNYYELGLEQLLVLWG